MDDLKVLRTASQLNDQNPLGSAAGFGVPLDLDRDLTTKLLGFSSLQNNVLYVQNSRGKIESVITSALSQIMIDLAKLSNDIIIYSMEEFGFFEIGEAFKTGSSIMPKKRNPDILELIRGKASVVAGYSNQIMDILKNLPSGYHRDLQETKGLIINSLKTTHECVEIVSLVIGDMKVNKERLTSSFSSQIFAADEAFKLVAQGIPFRDAYKHVDYNFQNYRKSSPEDIIKKRKSKGTTGNLGIQMAKKRLDREISRTNASEKKFREAINNLIKI